MFDLESVSAILWLLPFGYITSLPVYWILHKLMQKFVGLEGGFWKLSVVAFIAWFVQAYLAVLAWGGDGKPPPIATSWTYILLGAVAFTAIFWIGARLLSKILSLTATLITLTYAFLLLCLVVFMTRSGS